MTDDKIGSRQKVRTTIYLDESDYNQLRAALIVTHNGKSVSEWIRSVIKSFLRKQEQTITP